jgi:hypothetical protein
MEVNMYFNAHPTIKYNDSVVVDIFHKVAPITELLNNTVLFQLYDVKDNETPELLAYKLYGSTEYHWVLLTINNIINVNTDWPKSTQDFNTYVSNKYAIPDERHHYEDEDGDIVDTVTNYPISNYVFEERINEAQSRIKVLKPEYLNSFVENFKALL